MNYKKILLIVVSIIIVAGVGAFAFYQQKGSSTQAPVVKETAAINPASTEPQRTDFGVNMPTDFPTDIPTEAGAKLSQSYALNYSGQKQLTIVFLSTKTVKENYTLYADFLKKQSWNLVNKYESPKLSSLYGTKESNDINVTISENTATSSWPSHEPAGSKSQVSISILKK